MPKSITLDNLTVKADNWEMVASIELKPGYPPKPPIIYPPPPTVHQLMVELEKLVNKELGKIPG